MQKTAGATFGPTFFQGKMKVFEGFMVFSKVTKCFVFNGFDVAKRLWEPIFKTKTDRKVLFCELYVGRRLSEVARAARLCERRRRELATASAAKKCLQRWNL